MKQHAPATERNREPIALVLQSRLPSEGTVLEIASGTGQHAVYMAEKFSHLIWQPTEPTQEGLASIKAWTRELELPNLNSPVAVDVNNLPWPVESAEALFCANMIHISRWESCINLFVGASKVLKPQSKLFLYGPFFVDGQPTTESNQAFDLSLKRRNPQWGIRDIADVKAEAEKNGFVLTEQLDMPANNFIVVFEYQN